MFADSDGGIFNVHAFKISPLWGIWRTAPYFHDNSPKTLADVAAHYAKFLPEVVTGGVIVLTPSDQQDIVNYMLLLN